MATGEREHLRLHCFVPSIWRVLHHTSTPGTLLHTYSSSPPGTQMPPCSSRRRNWPDGRVWVVCLSWPSPPLSSPLELPTPAGKSVVVQSYLSLQKYVWFVFLVRRLLPSVYHFQSGQKWGWQLWGSCLPQQMKKVMSLPSWRLYLVGRHRLHTSEQDSYSLKFTEQRPSPKPFSWLELSLPSLPAQMSPYQWAIPDHL